MDATQKNLTAGDTVFAHPVVDGKQLARHKGIVIGEWVGHDVKRVVVWFYGMGDADGTTCHLMFRDELTKSGDIFYLSARQAAKLSAGARDYVRSRTVAGLLAGHARRMASLDLMPV